MAKAPLKTTQKPKPKSKPEQKGLGSKAMQAALGTEDYDIQKRRFLELSEAAYFSKDDSKEQIHAKMYSVGKAVESLAPKDESERMLVWQMVAAHGNAMECLRRAMIAGQSFERRDNNLKHAEKLMALYTKQLETLNKHRGKGQQKITVQHVNVESGGQAIVGNVDGKEKSSQQSTQMLTEDKEVPIDFTPAKKASKSKSRK